MLILRVMNAAELRAFVHFETALEAQLRIMRQLSCSTLLTE